MCDTSSHYKITFDNMHVFATNTHRLSRQSSPRREAKSTSGRMYMQRLDPRFDNNQNEAARRAEHDAYNT